MARWTLRDWLVGQVLPSSQLDAEFQAIYNSFVWDLTWTPAISATSINVTYNLQEGAYLQIGDTVFANANLKLNTVTNAGTGDYSINLPVDARDPGASFLARIGTADVYDNSATTLFQATVVRSSASTCKLRRDGTSGNVTAAAPFAWATNDELCLKLIYRTA